MFEIHFIMKLAHLAALWIVMRSILGYLVIHSLFRNQIAQTIYSIGKINIGYSIEWYINYIV